MAGIRKFNRNSRPLRLTCGYFRLRVLHFVDTLLFIVSQL